MKTAVPCQPHCHENRKKVIKCENMAEYIAGIIIWCRGIFLGEVENLGGEESHVVMGGLCAI